MTPVTDPAILAQLNGSGAGKPVTDPAILAQLNGGEATPSGSAVSSLMTGIANGGTFNLMAPLAAALGATTGEGPSKAPAWRQRYNEDLAAYRAQDQATHQAHPVADISGQIIGGVINPAIKALPIPKTLPGAIAQGAGIGAGYGAGSSVTSQDSLPDAAKNVGIGAAIGGAVPAVIPAVGWAAKKAGQGISHALGLTTGVGAKPIQEAFQAGVSGGDQAQALTSNMRGNTPWSDVVDEAKAALGKMRADRNATYRSGMVDISSDPTVLSFDPIDEAMSKVAKVKTYAGRSGTATAQDLSKSTAGVRQEIQETINNWRSLDPAEFHTPEGFDALKQQIGDIRDNLPFNTPQRVVADNAYNAVRKTIAEQAPAYNKVMSDYSQASDAIDGIQKELSLGPKGNPGTAMRKLQSVMRDNVNTGYGNRASYADALRAAGAKTLMPALAGQALSTVVPRGLGRVLGGAEIGATLMAPGLALKTGGLLAASSPRLVGEAAYGLGRGVGTLGSLPAINGLIPLNGANAVAAPSIAALVPAMLPRLPH